MSAMSLAPVTAATLSLALLGAGADPRPGADDAAARPRAAIVEHETAHLSVRAALSPDAVAPGSRVSIVVDIVPKPGMHVYAPGTEYRPIALVLEPHALLHMHEPVYPEPTLYLFKPLNEAVLVYGRPFRLVRDVTAGRTAAHQAKLRKQKTVTIAGALEYQACDDRVCYLPASVPVGWTVRIAS